MNPILQAIENVADKRHQRACTSMPEKDAAKIAVNYLTHIKNVWKENKYFCLYIESLIEGYSVAL